MRRRRKKYDLYLVIFLLLVTVGYFIYNHVSSEDRGIVAYQEALLDYKDADLFIEKVKECVEFFNRF